MFPTFICIDKLTVIGVVVLQGCVVESTSPPERVATARGDRSRTPNRSSVGVDGE